MKIKFAVNKLVFTATLLLSLFLNSIYANPITGTAYRWHSNLFANSDYNKVACTALNDGNINNTVFLKTGTASANITTATANTYEAAGILFTGPKSVYKFSFTSGAVGAYEGSWSANLTLQGTTDGTTWVNLSNWSITPVYVYLNNSSTSADLTAASNATYIATYTGSTVNSLLGIRVCGQVYTNGINIGSRAAGLKEVIADDGINGNAILGTAYRWHSNTVATSDNNKTAASTLNDGNNNNPIFLKTGTTVSAIANALPNSYEAAGIIFSSPKPVDKITFKNGTVGPYEGNWSANVTIQGTTDGTTWVNLTGWTITPNYLYINNSSSTAVIATASNATYIATSAGYRAGVYLGVRVCGQVNSNGVGMGSRAASISEISAEDKVEPVDVIQEANIIDVPKKKIGE